MARTEASNALGLLDILPILPPPAAQTVVGGLWRSLSSARLVCRALRAFVDDHVTHVNVQVETQDPQIWTTQFAHRLERFPSLKSARLRVRGPRANRRLADFAALPFQALPLGTLSRFQGLSVSDFPEGGPALDGEVAVARLASLLPNLRQLDASFVSMTFGPAEQQSMFTALARLPHLEDLYLPSSRALGCVGSLAHTTRLRRLVIPTDWQSNILTSQMLAGISQLQHLTELVIRERMRGHDEADGPGGNPLLDILTALPASVERLDVRLGRPGEPFLPVDIRLVRGQLATLEIPDCADSDDIPPLSLLADAARQLLACRQMPAPPARVQLLYIEIARVGEPQTASADSPELQPLWALLQRCERVRLRRLDLPPDPQYVPVTVGALERLGKPEVLQLGFVHTDAFLELREEEESAVWAAGAAGQEQQGPPEFAGPSGAHAAGSLPTLAQAAERVVRFLTQPKDVGGGAVAAALTEAGCSLAVDTGGPGVPPSGPVTATSAGVAAACPDAAALRVGSEGGAPPAAQRSASPEESFPPWMEERASRLLLLRGGAVDVLAQAPVVLHQWVSWLDEKAAALLGGGHQHQQEQQQEEEEEEEEREYQDKLEEVLVRRRRLDGGRVVWYYQLLPAPASLLLIRCRKGAGQAGAAAVAAVAAAAVEGRQAGVLEVRRLVPRAVAAAHWFSCSWALFEGAVEEVLKDIWKQHAASVHEDGALPAGGELALLLRLLELAVALTPVRFGG